MLSLCESPGSHILSTLCKWKPVHSFSDRHQLLLNSHDIPMTLWSCIEWIESTLWVEMTTLVMVSHAFMHFDSFQASVPCRSSLFITGGLYQPPNHSSETEISVNLYFFLLLLSLTKRRMWGCAQSLPMRSKEYRQWWTNMTLVIR